MVRTRDKRTKYLVALPEDDFEIDDFDIPVRKRTEKDEESDDAKPQKEGLIGVKDMPGACDMEDEDEEEEEGEEEDEGEEEV
jgi:hypothetical protein